MHAIVGIPYAMGVVVIAVVSFCYLVTAGYWGVSTTDIIQGITIAVSCLLVAVIVITKSGGVTEAVTYMGSVSPSHIQPSSGLTFAQLFSWAGVWALIAFGQPQLVTKFMGLRDSRTVGTVIRVAVVWEIIFMVSIAMIGAAAFKLFGAVPFDNVDAIVPTLVAEHTNAVVSGIFLCGILAAGLSTTVALVLTSSGAVTKDIYEDYYCARSNAKQDSGKSVRISRFATGIILVVVVIGSIYPPDFIWSLSTMSAGVSGEPPFTAPHGFGALLEKGNLTIRDAWLVLSEVLLSPLSGILQDLPAWCIPLSRVRRCRSCLWYWSPSVRQGWRRNIWMCSLSRGAVKIKFRRQLLPAASNQ
ncbi:MAG: sodium:solute symporter family transporter [Enterocloster bolteae]